MLQPVILCGGDGTRLWPASRKALPKQFMPLHGSTLFIDTLVRAAALPEAQPALVLCNAAHRFLAAVQMQDAAQPTDNHNTARVPAAEQEKGRILLEPVGKNTAPAVAIAALHCLAEDPLLLILSADHAIPDTSAFARSVVLGMEAARRYCNEVLPCMNEVRRHADMLETRVADDLWALPNYQEILFGK